MAAASSSSRSTKRLEEDQPKEKQSNLLASLSHLKKQIQASRSLSVKEKIERNRKDLRVHTARLLESASRSSLDGSETENSLSYRLGDALCRIGGWEPSKELAAEKEGVNVQEENPSTSSVVFGGGNGGGRSVVRLVKLPYVEKIPPYTTWIFLDRNQRMAEDQSVVGRRRIYYDPYGNETLICSDSDEEIAEPEEEKHDFSEGEDQLLWKVLKEHGLNSEVLHILNQFTDASPAEIKGRYEALMDRYQEKQVKSSEASDQVRSEGKPQLDKTLSASLDSFDNLFCRRCLVFDCRLHGCSQSLIIPSEKQPYGYELEDNRNPCGEQCYLRIGDAQDQCYGMSTTGGMSTRDSISLTEKLGTVLSLESEDSNPDDGTYLETDEGMGADVNKLALSPGTEETSTIGHPGSNCDLDTVMPEVPMKVKGKRKVLKHQHASVDKTKYSAELGSVDKKQKILSESDLPPRGQYFTNCLDTEIAGSDLFQKESVDESIGFPSKTQPLRGDKTSNIDVESSSMKVCSIKKSSNRSKAQFSHDWTTMEKDLYLKGIEIFGKKQLPHSKKLTFWLEDLHGGIKVYVQWWGYIT
ncbi:histone-lysine N-methyltransferase EZ3 isoform X2 [Iris pallida]|uniref:Histone-lysine N-methyltransferase EZ3 isoform X2 n=1 Tax=Iris pallida TaxID=29817 RepID=A0AAX6EUA5_IRIPA|nr:histone-lysine N-methyltransferase EZ3 isoform X2 [Iris pallida]